MVQTISQITSHLESWAPPSLQEGYDNSGLIVGSGDAEVEKALISLDVTEEVLAEAKKIGCGLIVSHHPIVFSGLKKLNGKNYVERIVMEAIRQNIALYAIHTNLDNVAKGVNGKIADCLALKDRKILQPIKKRLRKLITFAPDMAGEDGQPIPEKILEALWQAGAGHVGNYDQCSFKSPGKGSFRGLAGTKPFIGEEDKLEMQDEVRIEVIYPDYLENQIIKSLKKAHPYEEVAYDLVTLENENQETGAGMIGTLDTPMEEMAFLFFVKKVMEAKIARHSPFLNKKIQKVAVCGGAGSFLLGEAIKQGADALVTADFKYHQFFDADGKILIADIGHFESEQFTIDLIYDKIIEKFPNFAVLKTAVNTNPVNYL